MVRTSGPFRAQRAGEILRAKIARAGEGEEPPPLMARDLRHDMGGGAEAVDPDQWRIPGHTQSAVSDQTSAHQGRRLDIAVARIDRKAITLVGDGELGIAAIDLIAGEPGAVAQILMSLAAILADAAGPTEPGHPDPVADRETVDRFPLPDDASDDLVPGHQRQFRVGKLAVDDMQIGPADGAGPHRDQDLLRSG